MSNSDYTEKTLPGIVAAAAERYGDAPAITEGSLTLSYADLDRMRQQAAHAFCAGGINHGDRISIWAPNVHEWVVAALGAQTVGAVLVPLSTRMKGAEAAYQLQASGARMLFTVGEFLGARYPEMLKGHDLPDLERVVLFDGDAPGCGSWREFLQGANQVSPEDVAAREIGRAHV